MNAPRTQYDVIIAGGGMVGTSLALALATLDLDIAVVEPVERRAPGQPSFDDRSTALSRSSQRMFTALGLWDEIVAASTPIRHVHVSDKGRFGFAHIDADEQGVEALGYVVINRVLGGVLQAALDREKRAKLICPARIVSAGAVRDPATVVVERSDGSQSELSARLLVAADGARSSVRDMLGIGSEFVDYGQKAIIGNLMTGKAHENRAFERFTEEGPIAMLPIRDERTAFVWILPTDRADDVLEMDDDAVLVGNAAHGLHPVAAQGFNLGLRDVAALADCIADDMAEGNCDPGASDLLQRYADWRRSDQRKLVRFTDGIVRLFGSDMAPVRAARGLGMLGFDLVPGVRRLFARHTMGLAGRLPRLSRGVPLS